MAASNWSRESRQRRWPRSRSARACVALVTLFGAGAATADGPGEEIWVRAEPAYYSNGRNSKPENLDEGPTTATSKAGDGRTNTISWSSPPQELRPGSRLELTMSASTNEGAPMLGEWRVSGCGERQATVNDTTVVSFKGGLRRDDFSNGRFECVFTPGVSPSVQVKAGRYDDYSGEMTVVITWNYQRKKAGVASEPDASLSARLAVNGSESALDQVEAKVTDEPIRFQLKLTDAKPKGSEIAGATIVVSYDGTVIGREETDTSGDVLVSIPLPADTASGVSRHTVRAVATRSGYRPLDHSWVVLLRRNLEPIVVEASAAAGTYKTGANVTLSGRVYAHRLILRDTPVRAAIRVEDFGVGRSPKVLGQTVTDDDGRFTVSITADETTNGLLNVHATPADGNRFDAGQREVSFDQPDPETLEVTATTDQTVYPTDGTITLTGTTSSKDGPIDAEIRVEGRDTSMRRFHVAAIRSDGRFEVKFPVSALGRPNMLSVNAVQEGYYVLGLRASAPGHRSRNPANVYVAVRDQSDGTGLTEFEVTDVRGRPNVWYPSVSPGRMLEFNRPVVGSRYTQGAVLNVTEGAALALWMPMGGGGGVRLVIKGPTMARIGSLYKTAEGRVRLRVMVGEPGSLMVQTVHVGDEAVPLDYQIITASAVVTSPHTEYQVVVDERGGTSVAAKQDRAHVIPFDPATPVEVIQPGRSVSVAKVTPPAAPAPLGTEPGRSGGTLDPRGTPKAGADAAVPQPARPGATVTGDVPASLDLADGRFASNRWSSIGEKGAKATVAGDRLVLEVPKSSDGSAESFASAPVTGDFDLTVEYTLDEWVPDDDSSLRLTTYVSDKPASDGRRVIEIQRAAEGRSDVAIVANPCVASPTEKPLPGGRDGRWRIQRVGVRWTVSRASGAAWQSVDSFECTMPASVFLGFGLERQGAIGAKASVRLRTTR